MRKELSIAAGIVAVLSAPMPANEDVPAILERQTQYMLDAVSAGSEARITGFAERREAWDLVWTRLP